MKWPDFRSDYILSLGQWDLGPEEVKIDAQKKVGMYSITMPTSGPRYRGFCYTLNNYDINHIAALQKIPCLYHVYGKEVAPTTNTRHLQGFIYYENKKTWKDLKNVSETAHIEPLKGTPLQAADYCKKEKDFWESGEVPKQGQRHDLETAVKQVQDGKEIVDIISESPHLLPLQRSLREYKSMLLKPLNRDVEVIVLYGPAGSGKSSYAYTKYPSIYAKPHGKWWDGYSGQKEILLDDYYGYLPYSDLLRVLDRYPYNAEIKGGFMYAQWNTVIITSNKHPREWYTTGLTPALRRRIHKIFRVQSINGTPHYQEENDSEEESS